MRKIITRLFSARTVLFFLFTISVTVFALINIVSAQGSMGRWQVCGLTGTTSGSVTATGVGPNLTFSVLSRSAGIAAASATDGYVSSGWSTSDNLNTGNNDYYEFTITPGAGFPLSIGAIKIRDRVSTTSIFLGSFDAYLRFSDDGYTSNLSSWSPSTTITNRTINLGSIAALQNRTTPVTFRIYGSDAVDANTTYGIFCQGTAGGNFRGIDVDGTYKSQFISMNTGAATWCPGETRNVSVTVKNTGSLPWTDGNGNDFNIGVKWNTDVSTNPDSWADYHIRVDAGNLAPGQTATFTLPLTASNNAGAGYTNNLSPGTNNITFDIVYEGVSWFGDNNGGVGPGNARFISPNITISSLPQGGLTGNTICSNGGTGQLTFTATAGTGPFTIVYNDGVANRTVNSINSGVAFSVFTNPSTTSSYTLVSVTSAAGCTRSSGFTTGAATITVNNPPVIVINPVSQNKCAGQPVTFSVSASGSSPTYQWRKGASNISSATAASYTIAAVNPADAANYTVVVSTNGCTPVTSAPATLNVNARPTAVITSPNTAICSGSSTDITGTVTASGAWTMALSNGGGVITGNGNGSFSVSVSPTVLTTYSIQSLIDANCTSVAGDLTGSTTISVNPFPTSATASPVSSAVCLGRTVSLSGSATIASSSTTIDNFNAATSFTVTGTSSGSRSQVWQQEISGANVNSVATFTSPGGGNLMVATASDGNILFQTSSVNSVLTSGIINTTGFSSLSTLTFNHTYKQGNASGSGTFEVSTNGGSTWTTLLTFSSNVGSSTSFVSQSVNFSSYVNMTNLRIRFSFVTSNFNALSIASSWWAVDDILLNGVRIPLYSWTATTAPGVNGLPPGATNPSAANSSIVVQPSSTTAYTLTAANPVTGCSASTTPVTVTVYPAPSLDVNTDTTLYTSSNGTGDCNAAFNWTHPVVNTLCPTILQVAYTVGTPAPASLPAGGSVNAGGAASAIFAKGVTMVTYTATDQNNNIASSSFTITVSDDELPSITCPADVTVDNTLNQCDATITLSVPGTSDNCAVASVSNDHPSNIYPVGVTDVIWTVADNSNNINTCIQKVTVRDIQQPTITCSPGVTVSNDPGICGAYITLTTPGTADNCGVEAVTAARNDGLELSDVYPVGTTTVTWTVRDVNGNTNTCDQLVTVTDNEKPVISCPAPVTTVTDDGVSYATIILATPGVTDNCTGLIAVSNDHPGTTFPIGPTIVTWTAMDAAGNINTCTQTILVNDTIDPHINCNPPISINNTPAECNGETNVSYPAASDNSGHVTVTADYPGLNPSVDPVAPLVVNAVSFPVGLTTIVWTATDPSLNDSWCTQTVTVTDNEKPAIECPNAANGVNDPGLCSAEISLGVPVTSDNCGVLDVGNDHPSAVYPVGETTVTWTVTDIHNNINTCTQTVTITDTEIPFIANAADVNVPNDNGQCSATITLTPPSTNDNCAVLSVINDHPSSIFPVGSTTVVWTVTDVHNNINTSEQQVTVTDDELPVIFAGNNITQTADAGQCGALITVATATATDNCEAGTVTGTRSDALALNAVYPVGTTTVTWTVTDIHGNAAVPVKQTITVTDNELPVITAGANIDQYADEGQCGASVAIIHATATDNCSVGAVTGTRSDALALNAVYPVGTTTITWTVTDINGNAAVPVVQTIVIRDNERPVIEPAVTVSVNNDPGYCGAVLSIDPLTATDNCGVGATTGTRSDALALTDAYPVGTTTITWTVTDIHGNAALPVTQTVTVTDNELPVITASADITQEADAGSCSAVITVVNAAVTDNCGAGSPAGVRSDALALTDAYPVGTTTITWTVTDIHNNNAIPVMQTVTVTDNELPVIYAGDNISKTADAGQCAAMFTVASPVTKDNCAVGAATGTRSDALDLNDPYPVGSTLITWTVIDVHGNPAIPVTQAVTITDDELPVITSSGDITVDNDAGLCSASVVVNAATATDNCGVDAPAGVRSDALALSAPYPKGTTTISWTVSDMHGNAAVPVTQTITVKDTELPIITNCAPPVTVVPNNTGCTSLLLDYRNQVTASDNCSGLTLVQTPIPGTALQLGNNTVTITATDASGNSTSCSFVVTVNKTLDLSVTNSNPQLYYGYSQDQSTVIKGTPTGGAAPYKVVITMNRQLGCNAVTSTGDEVWSPSAGGTSTGNACPSSGAGTIPVSTITNVAEGGYYSLTATLMANAIITVTVTDKNGCTATKTTAVYSEDARCFAGNSGNAKVKICHRTGNSNDPCHELCVAESAVQAHLAHGDYIGSCTPNCVAPPQIASRNGINAEPIAESALRAKAIPNPAESFFAIMINSNSSKEVRVRITDVSGRIIEERTAIPNSSIQVGGRYLPGVYFAEILQQKEKVVLKLIKQ